MKNAIKVSLLCCFNALCVFAFSQAVWTPLGPTHNPGLGIGRLECIAFDPNYNGKTNRTMYVGSPTGGLWKSVNGGETWNNTDCSTDKLPFIGVADIAINPYNANEIFIATGTRYHRKTVYPIGVYQSSNGGKSWKRNSNGIIFNEQKPNCIARLLINPFKTRTMYIATSVGIFKTTNKGKKWTTILKGDFHGLELDPTNANIIYVAGTRSNYNNDVVIMRSENEGKSWEVLADKQTVLKANEHLVIDLAIVPTAPHIIYTLLANKDGDRSNDLFVSTDRGKTWQAKEMPYPNDHRDKVSIGISPTDSGEIYIGKAWDFYKSINILDTSFNMRSNSIKWQGLPLGHADVHDFAFAPITHELFVAHDGGLWNATTAKDASTGLNIATINCVGTSATKPGFLISGHQDCGANIFNDSLPIEQKWKNVLGGDGRESIIDYTNHKNILSASLNLGTAGVYGPNMRSINGGMQFWGISKPTTPGLNALNIGPMIEDPLEHKVFYFGYNQLYKGTFENETDNEMKWEQLSSIPNMMPYSVLTDINVSASNNKIIYIGFVGGRIFRSITGGENSNCSKNCWTEISPFNNLMYHNIVKIATAHNNPNLVWAAFAGTGMYIDKSDSATVGVNKIMYSVNGGQTWDAYAQGLPETPVNSIVYVKNSASLLFIATELGVYYRNEKMNTWEPFATGLPNVIVSELEVNYTEKKLYAATYGRGLWSIDIVALLK